MVLKRSVFEIQKQHTKNFKDPSYGYGAIHENVLKLRRFAQLRNFGTKEAYLKYRNNAPKFLKIQVIVTEQFMKMFQNCAIARNGAILDRGTNQTISHYVLVSKISNMKSLYKNHSLQLKVLKFQFICQPYIW